MCRLLLLTWVGSPGLFYVKQSTAHFFNKFSFRRSLCLYGKSNSFALDMTPLQSQPWRLNRVQWADHSTNKKYPTIKETVLPWTIKTYKLLCQQPALWCVHNLSQPSVPLAVLGIQHCTCPVRGILGPDLSLTSICCMIPVAALFDGSCAFNCRNVSQPDAPGSSIISGEADERPSNQRQGWSSVMSIHCWAAAQTKRRCRNMQNCFPASCKLVNTSEWVLLFAS